MGYLNARDHLESFILKKVKNKKEHCRMMDVLNDFEYCIEQAKRMEAVDEAVTVLKDAKLKW